MLYAHAVQEPQASPKRFSSLKVKTHQTWFSLRIEVAGGYYKITRESGHSEKNLTVSFYRPRKFSRKFHVVAGGFFDL